MELENNSEKLILNKSETSNVTILKPQVSRSFRKIAFQSMIFILAYVSYAGLHFTREGWSVLKSSIESENSPGLNWEDNDNTGLLDFVFLFAYSFGLFISGNLGDKYPIRIILPIGYLVV